MAPFFRMNPLPLLPPRRHALLRLTGLALLASACGGSTRAPENGAPPAGARAPAVAASIGGCRPAESGEELVTSDLNEDGRPEVCKYYRNIDDPQRPGQNKSALIRQDLDLNWDGRVDIKRTFDAEGTVVREEWDADYDGKVDIVRTFENGVIVRSEHDQNNDGRMEIVRHYTDGKLERKEVDTNGDGKTDRWEYYRGKVVDRVGVDKDYDGKVDSWAKARAPTPPSTPASSS